MVSQTIAAEREVFVEKREWRERLRLFDPDNRLPELLHGLNSILQEHYESFLQRQLEIAKMDPALGGAIETIVGEAGRADALAQYHARFTPPLDDSFAAYTQRFGRLLVSKNASPSTGMAMVSCAYGEAMKVVLETMEGEDLARAARAIRMLTSIESDILVGSMHEALHARYLSEISQRAVEFEDSVLATVAQLSETAERLKSSSGSAGEVSRELQDTSATMAASAQQSATAMEQAKATLVHLENAVIKVQASVASTDDAAKVAGQRADAAASNADQLGDSSKRIQSIVKLIKTIAEQTQILSLNATIEAARAGQAGSGFAVVANEVKELASKTQIAAGDIKIQAEDILAAARHSVDAAEDINRRMSTIGEWTESSRNEIDSQLQNLRIVVEAIAETFLSAEHLLGGVSTIDDFAGQMTARSQEVEEDFARVEDLLARLSANVGAYSNSLRSMIAEQEIAEDHGV
ncbi:Methyl-accepting chemotaxis protein [Aurantiacibacter gangjinensis]|uniref:Uncharacterized protein n=2 Tax=Aurantiacibacter gangjinensis TaxID=502682 RepID=A0A0G9MRI9_9SPHN|nr:Methyl-accepting chemotaxis protein [Aurantiacibacter gangjinensis]KLE33361.1 hypothetical protein AAW01_05340 [Aurantiacibacter gangjinensis]